MFKVQDRQCETCIYRPDSTLDIKALEKQIADPKMAGHFKGSRICHHSTDACCRGFWNRHKDHFDAGQLAQRLNLVTFVKVDTMKTKSKKNPHAVALGRRGGVVGGAAKSAAKTAAARVNGRRGGRPRICPLCRRQENDHTRRCSYTFPIRKAVNQ